MFFVENYHIDWNRLVDKFYNLIRGLSPYATAYTRLDGKMLKIFKATKEETVPKHAQGTCLTDVTSYLKFSCLDGYTLLNAVQLEGKKRMDIVAFLRGYHPSSVTFLS